MKLSKVFFKTEDGVELSGLLHEPEENTSKIVIAVHGMQSNCLKKRDDILAKGFTKNEIAYFCFNNRGHDLVNSITKITEEKAGKILCGSSLENIEESYYDIKSAVIEMLDMGYNEIYLQGHSLGCTKIVFTYNKMKELRETGILEKIKGVILLSLVDIPMAIQFFFPGDVEKLTTFMQEEQNKENGQNVYSVKGGIIPMCPNTFLGYLKNNKNIDFARYSDPSFEFPELNKIEAPLFMRWGNNNELIMQEAGKLCEMMKNKIKNNCLDINYIDGAGHNYRGYENKLFEEMMQFISQYNK